ncbi:MAG: twin-arginine translocase TatA/TatE family subunit [Candidatus Hydrogenedentes bacterium]|nr:twin-arginine translocase TatA/TatE family subunit [Candidatus Hydrogenedentota bacterium]
MFGGMSFFELVILMGIALVLIGPEKFPDFTKIVMRTIRDVRNYVNDIKQDLAEEVRPIKEEVRQLSRYKPEDYIDALSEADSSDDESETNQSASAGPVESTSSPPPADSGVNADTTASENYQD